MALQRSASLQRCHSNFWMHLSDGYRNLAAVVVQSPSASTEPQTLSYQALNCNTRSSALPRGTSPPSLPALAQLLSCNFENGSCCDAKCGVLTQSPARCSHSGTEATASSQDNLKVILVRTVQLFRPYFSWQEKISDVTGGECEEHVCTVPGEGCECRMQDKTRHTATNADTGLISVEAGATSIEVASLSCTGECLFNGVPVFQDPSLYSRTLLQSCNFPRDQDVPPLSGEGELVPDLSLPLCFSHSPFVMLVRRVLPPEELVRVMEELHGLSQGSTAHHLLASVYRMAACSCLVWARLVKKGTVMGLTTGSMKNL